MGPANYVGRDQPIGSSVHKQTGQETSQNAGRALNGAYQSAIYAAQDEKKRHPHGGDAAQKRKRRYTFEKLRKQTLSFAGVDSEQIRDEAEWDRGPR